MVYRVYYRAAYHKPLDLSQTDIIIEGYPRSANTFTAEALRIADPTILIASHFHSPGVVINGLARAVPCYVMIRDPDNAVPSWVIHSQTNLGASLDYYIDYYETLVRYIPEIRIVRFTDVTSHTDAVIAHMLATLHRVSPNLRTHAALQRETTALIYSKNRPSDFRKFPMPRNERTPLLDQLRTTLQNEEYTDRINHARKLHRAFSENAINIQGNGSHSDL